MLHDMSKKLHHQEAGASDQSQGREITKHSYSLHSTTVVALGVAITCCQPILPEGEQVSKAAETCSAP